MSQANSSKEPSMDEILASIRRIIESGEERPKPALTATALRQAAETSFASRSLARPSRAHDEEADRPLPAKVVAFTERFEPDLDAGAPDEASPEPFEPPVGAFEAFAQAPVPVNDDEVLVETMHLIDDDFDRRDAPFGAQAPSAASPESFAAAPALPSSDVARLDDFALEFDEQDFIDDLKRDAGLRPPLDDEDAHPPAASNDIAPESFEHASADGLDAPAVRTVRDAAAPVGGRMASMIAETSALMSDQAGAQVAAAFDDLAQAIRDGQMRSMETMAREMLRPMLQDWLDDNLPRLVERLVREEIERVSRGGRR